MRGLRRWAERALGWLLAGLIFLTLAAGVMVWSAILSHWLGGGP